jgi:hypothetical protein
VARIEKEEVMPIATFSLVTAGVYMTTDAAARLR